MKNTIRSTRAVLAAAVGAEIESLEGRVLLSAYTIADLGTLGGPRAEGHAINSTGKVAGASAETVAGNLVTHAFATSGTSLTDLGTIGGDNSSANGINATGVIVGQSDTALGGTDAFVYTGGAIQDLGTLPGGAISTAAGINDAGVIVGQSQVDSNNGPSHAFVYDGSLRDIGTLTGHTSDNSSAAGINNNNQIVGTSDAADGSQHAFIAQYSTSSHTATLTDVGLASGTTATAGTAINDSGDIAGYATLNDGTQQAFIRVHGQAYQLLAPVAGDTDSAAQGINASGDVVGYSGPDLDSQDARAFLYSGGVVKDLNALLPANSGWFLSDAYAINDTGQITGIGTFNGQQRAFLMTPPAGGSGGADTTAPQGQIHADPVSTVGQQTQTVTVTYVDDTGIDASTIDVHDLSVSRSPGGSPLTVTGVTLNPASGNAASIVATYTVAAPGGTWDAADDGTYDITISANQVKDTSGNAATGTGTFTADLGQFSRPTVSIQPITTFPAGAVSQALSVTYSDNNGVSIGTIDTDDITITAPGGALLPITSATPSGSGNTVTAVYTFTPPGGSWDAGDNGSYTVAVQRGQVFDQNGNAAPATSATFTADVAAPPSTIDPTFGGGQVSANFVAEALTTDVNGRIILAGHLHDLSDGSSQSVIERLNVNGSIDTSFGNGGSIISPAGSDDAFYALTTDATGRLYASGTQKGNFLVARFKANGSIDARFGNHGRATTDMGGTDDAAYGIVIQPDGAIVLGGGASNTFAFSRFTTSGNLDTTFGTGGRAAFAAGSGGAVGALAIDSQGRIVAAGGSGANVAVIRLTAAGAQDATFDGGNAVTLNALGVRTDLGGPDRTVGLALQSDGKILVANRTTGGDFGLARLNDNGNLDTDFANQGIATVDFGGDDDADTVTVQGSGEIYVLGTTDAAGPQAAIAAFNSDGSLDTSFNGTGQFTVDAGVTSAGRALHVGDLLLRAFGGIQANGQLVVGTPSQSGTVSSTPLRRLNVPGSGTVGSFGAVNGRKTKLAFADSHGTKITLQLKGGGTGTAFFDGTFVDLVLTGTTARSTLAVGGRGGAKRVALRDVRADGSLRAFNGKNSDVSGTFFINGSLAKATIGNLTGTLAASSAIGSVNVAGSLTGAKVLSGTNLGSGGKLGGADTAADVFSTGTINSIKVSGSATDSVVGAGVDPVDGTYRDGDDTVVGGTSSAIRSIAIKHGVDDTTRFIAGAFGKAKIPAKVDPATNDHFQVLP